MGELRRGEWWRCYADAADHPKVIAAGNEAFGVWCRVNGWARKFSETGDVPIEIVQQKAGRKWKQIANKLVEVGLWKRNGKGIVIHDWLDHQTPLSEMGLARNKAAARQAKHRDVTRDKNDGPAPSNATQQKEKENKRDGYIYPSKPYGARRVVPGPKAPDPLPTPPPDAIDSAEGANIVNETLARKLA